MFQMYLQQPHLSCVELKRVHDFLRKVQVGVEGLLEVADWTNDVSLLLCHRLILESCRDRLDVDGSQSRLVHQREMLEMLRELYEKTQTQHPQHESLLHNVRQFLEGWKRDFLDGNRLFQQVCKQVNTLGIVPDLDTLPCSYTLLLLCVFFFVSSLHLRMTDISV